jgi:subtilase family serine protease
MEVARVRKLIRGAIVVLIAAAPAVWYACADSTPNSPAGPSLPISRMIPDLRAAITAQRHHTDELLAIPGVVGTAVTVQPDGHPGLMLLLERAGITGLPTMLEGIPVSQRVTGRLMAFSDPTTRQRPAPMGFSVGHPAITAGTIGARVRDALGRVYILSNNHVLANSNGASIGDPEYQPGPFDGGTAADQIATLSDFQVISFAVNGTNTIDAAIALSTTSVLDNATPADDGYSMPNSTIFGDANGDGLFDDRNALLGLNVQKYGRTTKLTHGQITGINATVTICYAVSGFTCTKTARYVDQLLITPGGFSNGGDSGSLIVTDDANLNPVALLFAGNANVTIANRIDLVLQRFGVVIDGFAPPPPGPLTDLAVTSVSGPSSAVQGSPSTVTVSVKNVGNQDVATFDVTLQDTTAHETIGTQSVAGLVAGASTTLTFTWTPSTSGDHDLVARQTLSDDRATNDQRLVTVTVDPPVTDIAISGFSGPGAVIVGHSVNVGVTVANIGNQNVAGDITVTLQDSTAGVTLGTQTISGLAAGANTTLVFSWNTTDATLGGHTLVATHALSDNNAANNRRSTVVSVVKKPLDIAVTGITGPRSVTQGDTAHVGVTVQNVGEVDVTAPFNVELSDGWMVPVVATGTVPSLAAGTSITFDIPWNTAGAAITGHTLFANSKLPDDNSSNNSVGIAINVTAPGPPVPPPPPPPPPGTDVAITGITGPARVKQGDTAHVVVTVKNMGGQDVTGNFDVVLADGFNGPIVATQTITGLAVGVSVTRTLDWNTAGVAITGHTLFATQKLADSDPSNNTYGISILVEAPPVTDVAVSSVVAPAVVMQGTTATIGVTVQNVGGLNVSSSFDVTLFDSTAGVTLGTQTLAGLAVGSNTTPLFTWNTTGAAVGGHRLVATHSLSDANAANNQSATSVTVNAPITDVAVTDVSAPTSVIQGSVATVNVTVQNVGGQNVVSSFNVVLTDATAGGTIGTQTMTGLALGTSATRSFTWNTTGASLGGHTLVASQTLTDDNGANNQRSVAVTVNPQPADLAVTGITGPAQVTQGDTAPVVVTVQNVGGVDVNTSFDVVLTDGTAGGITVGSQTIAGLAAGASATRTINWNTAGAATTGHILIATQKLADNNRSNDAVAIAINVNPPNLHVGNLDGVATSNGNTWTATAVITVHDSRHNLVNGASVRGLWNGANPEVGCVTGAAGTCSVVLEHIPNATRYASFSVTAMSLSGYVYKAALNHDPDGSSNGFSVTVRR